MAKPRPAMPEPEGPAVVTSTHVRDRLISTVAGAPKAWRNMGEHPLSIAWFKGLIDDDEFAAGECYRAFWEKMQRPGKDSTQFVVVSGDATPLTDNQIDAMRIVEGMETNLRAQGSNGSRYAVLVRKLCGERHTPAEACRAAGFKNPRDVKPTIKLALSKLSVAITKTSFVIRTSLSS